MYDVITIGGATRDIFLVSDDFQVEDGVLHLTWGEKKVCQEIYFDIGGGSCNSAVGLARLGLHAAFWGQVGHDSGGEAVAKRLKEEGVSLQFLVVSDKSRTSTSAVLCSKNGEHTIVMYRGKNDDLLEGGPSWEELCQTKWFYLADVASQTEDLTWKIAELAEEKGIKLCFVPGQHQLKLGVKGLERVLRTTEIFILNAFEAQTLLNEKKPEIPKMLKSFAQFGPKIVVITQDVNGAWGYDGQEVYFEEAPATKVVDTTGAGDAFSSAFLAAIFKNNNVAQALKWGSINAGSVISQFGAQTGLLKNIANTS